VSKNPARGEGHYHKSTSDQTMRQWRRRPAEPMQCRRRRIGDYSRARPLRIGRLTKLGRVASGLSPLSTHRRRVYIGLSMADSQSQPPPIPQAAAGVTGDVEVVDAEMILRKIVADVGSYPIDAYVFVNEGVSYTVQKTHGKRKSPEQDMHISGAQLCHGLRDLAIQRWGMLAGTVLKRWNLTTTLDFGRIVFALVDNGLMSKTDRDRVDDFRGVYDFRHAFDEHGYKIEAKA
jgi:uncharacterized repeat protein (TIGR04138 family)